MLSLRNRPRRGQTVGSIHAPSPGELISTAQRPDRASERGHREGSRSRSKSQECATAEAVGGERGGTHNPNLLCRSACAARMLPRCGGCGNPIPQERPRFFPAPLGNRVRCHGALGAHPSRSVRVTQLDDGLLLAPTGRLALVSKYASRAALFGVLFGSATLAFLWYFKGAYHAQQFAFAVFLLFFLLAAAPTGYFVILCRRVRTASRSGQFRCQAGTNGSVRLFCFAVNLCP